MMRWVLAVGFLLWVSELLWLPAVVPPERWQTALWVEATVTQSLPPPMARLAADVEEGYAFALELTKAPFLALAGRDVREGREGSGGRRPDAAGEAFEKSVGRLGKLDYWSAMRFQTRLIMKRTGLIVAAFAVLLPLVAALLVDGFARRRIRIVTMKAPKPVLFNLCWISLGYGFLATGFILPWPIPMPAELWGLMPVAVGVIVHRAVMHYHRFL